MNIDNKKEVRHERGYRSIYENKFIPLGIFFSKFASANFYTYLGVTFAICTSISLLYSKNGNYLFMYIALIFIVLSGLADVIDGNVARAEISKGKKIGKYGALLDPVADRYAEFFFLLGIALSQYCPPEWILISYTGMIMASYTRARGESLGPDNYGNRLFISAGVERKEKLFAICLGIIGEALLIQTNSYYLWPYFNFNGYIIGPLALSVLIIGLLSHIAVFQRLNLAKRLLESIN